jgi:NAD(P)-dependent dehydrogenase (short-subunit alcohol dehydrogenase family)
MTVVISPGSSYPSMAELFTGGSSGIGFATAKQFVKEGAYVFITGRRQEALDKAVAEIGSNVTAIRGDVTKRADLEELYRKIAATGKGINLVIANAGDAIMEPLGDISEKTYQAGFDLNVKGVLFTVQLALPLLRDGGSIVIVGSIAGSKGLPGMSVYSAAKAAVRSFARTRTLELQPRKIRVNVLSPGPVLTSRMQIDVPQEYLDFMKAKVPMERLASEIEIARAIAFLASSESSFITGVELFADGGLAQV